MMTSQQKLDVKLEFVKLVISDVETEYREADGVERLLEILEVYEHLLLRTKLKMQTDLDDLTDLRKAVQDAGELIQDMHINEPELMQGWYHGAIPKNKAHALASLLARVMVECMTVVEQFETKYPELKSLLSGDGKYHALEPGAADA